MAACNVTTPPDCICNYNMGSDFARAFANPGLRKPEGKPVETWLREMDPQSIYAGTMTFIVSTLPPGSRSAVYRLFAVAVELMRSIGRFESISDLEAIAILVVGCLQHLTTVVMPAHYGKIEGMDWAATAANMACLLVKPETRARQLECFIWALRTAMPRDAIFADLEKVCASFDVVYSDVDATKLLPVERAILFSTVKPVPVADLEANQLAAYINYKVKQALDAREEESDAKRQRTA